MAIEVLIVGAGPTGLVQALWLTKQGTKVRIIDKLVDTTTQSRAIVIHARTLELYDQLDLASEVIDRGHEIVGFNIWTGGHHRARLNFNYLGASLTRYPFVYNLPQDQHEKLLTKKLSALGVQVERQTELVDFVDHKTHIIVTLQKHDGSLETCQALYIIGCDGAHSAVRQIAKIGFDGDVYPHLFYVADIEGSGPTIDGEVHVSFNPTSLLLSFGYDDGRRLRLIGIMNDAAANKDLANLTFEDVSSHAIEILKLKIDNVTWFSPYHVHHRVAQRFRKGRAFLVGDAAHVHSPAGGQGMNTGIGDAINLAWKLSAVLQDQADECLLDTYESERIKFAQRLVHTTDRAFRTVADKGAFAAFLRTWVVPYVLPFAFSFSAVRSFLFRTVSQILVDYRESPISLGVAGSVHAGDRLPWIKIGTGDNYGSLATMRWQVHIYGSIKPDLEKWMNSNSIKVHVFEWQKEYALSGLVQNACYLLRPDTYIALVVESADPGVIQRYFSCCISQPEQVQPGPS